MTQRVDAIVVGVGVGGEAVAGQLLDAGLSVVAIEPRLVGGECPYWGCVPSKMMIRAADALAEARRVPKLAGNATVTPSWEPVARRIRDEATDDWDDAVAAKRLTDKGCVLVRDHARLRGPLTVEADGTTYEASRALVLATGTEPVVPPIDGLAGTPLWTNREAIEATEVPSSLIVLGGGAIGVELAQVFARFGSDVTVVESHDRLLAMEEPESSEVVAAALARDGIDVRTGARATKVGYDGTFTVTLSDGTVLRGEKLLVATGRRVNLKNLGVDSIGLDPGARSLDVDEWLRVADRTWAVGDVTGHGAFTHVATYQADVAVRSILGKDGPPANYDALPRVTFTDPEVGAVGLTEAQARERGVNVAIGGSRMPESSRGWIHKEGNDGFVKLVVDTDRDVLVGATSAGPNGGEILGALSVAVHGKVPVSHLREMIYAYPTFHRAIQAALAAIE